MADPLEWPPASLASLRGDICSKAAAEAISLDTVGRAARFSILSIREDLCCEGGALRTEQDEHFQDGYLL